MKKSATNLMEFQKKSTVNVCDKGSHYLYIHIVKVKIMENRTKKY